jgi:hypothetical protein
MLDKAMRELDRERMGLQNQEKKLVAEIKKMAKDGQMVRVLEGLGGAVRASAACTAPTLRRRPLAAVPPLGSGGRVAEHSGQQGSPQIPAARWPGGWHTHCEGDLAARGTPPSAAEAFESLPSPCSHLPRPRWPLRCALHPQDAVKVMAKSLIRNRHAVTKLHGLKSQLQAISLRIQVGAPGGGPGRAGEG